MNATKTAPIRLFPPEHHKFVLLGVRAGKTNRAIANLRRGRLYAGQVRFLCRVVCPMARLLSASGGGTARRGASPDSDWGSIT
jgi:hypothetical protein